MMTKTRRFIHDGHIIIARMDIFSKWPARLWVEWIERQKKKGGLIKTFPTINKNYDSAFLFEFLTLLGGERLKWYCIQQWPRSKRDFSSWSHQDDREPCREGGFRNPSIIHDDNSRGRRRRSSVVFEDDNNNQRKTPSPLLLLSASYKNKQTNKPVGEEEEIV
jgi:hypothetical protein